MTRNGTFLLAKATSTATLARSPRVIIVPYMKMKQYWARGRILVQRGFVSRGKLFFNQTGNCSPPSHFFALFVIKICKTPWFLSRLEKEKHLYFGHFQQNVNLPFIQPARWHDSARAVTGKRCPHSGVGGDFLARRPAKMEFGPKSRVFGPKKNTFLGSNHVLATTGKSCANKKVPFSQIDISIFPLRNIYLKHMDELYIYKTK